MEFGACGFKVRRSSHRRHDAVNVSGNCKNDNSLITFEKKLFSQLPKTSTAAL